MAILSKCDLCPMEVCVGLEFLGHLHAAHQVSNNLAIFINSLHLQRQTANQPVVALEDQENVPQDNDDGDVEEVSELPQDDDDGEVEEEIIEDGEVEEVIELPQELERRKMLTEFRRSSWLVLMMKVMMRLRRKMLSETRDHIPENNF